MQTKFSHRAASRLVSFRWGSCLSLSAAGGNTPQHTAVLSVWLLDNFCGLINTGPFWVMIKGTHFAFVVWSLFELHSAPIVITGVAVTKLMGCVTYYADMSWIWLWWRAVLDKGWQSVIFKVTPSPVESGKEAAAEARRLLCYWREFERAAAETRHVVL